MIPHMPRLRPPTARQQQIMRFAGKPATELHERIMRTTFNHALR